MRGGSIPLLKRGSEALQLVTTWGDREINYTLFREPRRDLTITIYPDRRVVVRAPVARPLESVFEYIAGKRPWIAKKLGEFEKLPAPPRFETGESHLYLGHQYPLHVERTGRGVALESDRLLVRVRPAAGSRAVRLALRRWYADRAATVFPDRIGQVRRGIPLVANLDHQLRIRLMTRRWGSCTSRRVVTLNPLLVQAPLPCVDYVIVHELVHLLELSHNARFYRLMDQALPDWRERRAELTRMPIRPM